MRFDEEEIDEMNKRIIEYGPYSLRNLLDHLVLLSWFQLMGHSCANVPAKNVNLDNREFITLPSGRKVRITMIVEDITDEMDRKEAAAKNEAL